MIWAAHAEPGRPRLEPRLWRRRQPYQQADLTWRMQNVQLQGGLYGETGNYTRWADLSGSLVWMDNAVFASNRINDAFVLVSTKGYPQVPIRYEN